MFDKKFKLEANQISYFRDNHKIVNALSFKIQAGCLLQIVGPNGVGKTTLLRILTGLLQPDEGTIYCDGAPIHQQLDDYQKKIFYLDHIIAVKPQLKAIENILYDSALALTSKDQALAALARFNLEACAEQLTGQLSRGQKQRLALCKMLCSSASLYLLDEPFTALDDSGVAITQQVLLEFLEKGRAIILSSHRLLSLAHSMTTLALGESE